MNEEQQQAEKKALAARIQEALEQEQYNTVTCLFSDLSEEEE